MTNTENLFKRNAFEQIFFAISGVLLILTPILKWINSGFLDAAILLIAILVTGAVIKGISEFIIGNLQKSNYSRLEAIHGAERLERLARMAEYGPRMGEEDFKIFKSVVAPQSAQNFSYIYRVIDVAVPIILYNVIS